MCDHGLPSEFDRLEGWIAFLIAMVSLTAALAAWRTANLGSKAGDAIYQGMLDAVKQQALANENWRETYQEAGLPSTLMYNESKNFGPRLGLAYRVSNEVAFAGPRRGRYLSGSFGARASTAGDSGHAGSGAAV